MKITEDDLAAIKHTRAYDKLVARLEEIQESARDRCLNIDTHDPKCMFDLAHQQERWRTAREILTLLK